MCRTDWSCLDHGGFRGSGWMVIVCFRGLEHILYVFYREFLKDEILMINRKS